ncbi:MAG: hypothetical protein ACR2PA_13740 [Hyphomicrobiaceae bacterium]
MFEAAKYIGGDRAQAMGSSYAVLENEDFVSTSVKSNAVGWAVAAITILVVLTACY